MNEFDHRPDAELGELLRAHLAAPDDAAFLARFRERLQAELAMESQWEILARWSRLGVAALLLMALGFGFWLGQSWTPGLGSATLADAVVPADAPAALLTSRLPPTRDVMLAAVLE